MWPKRLYLFTLLGLATTACAPQRAQFTLPFQKKAQDSATQVALPVKFVTPTGLTITTDAAKSTALEALVTQLDANTTSVAAGDFRVFKRRDPVTKAAETRQQTITAVHDGVAEYQTKNIETGEQTASGRLLINEFTPIREGVRALSQQRYDDFYELVATAMTLQAGIAVPATDDIPVEIEVRQARFVATNPPLFRLSIVARIYSDKTATGKGKPRLFSLEARFSPTAPRPFDISYLAFGKDAASKIFLDISSFGTASR